MIWIDTYLNMVHPTAVALLAQFGAANLKDVKSEQFDAALAAAKDAAGA
jgi:hypothetical protein